MRKFFWWKLAWAMPGMTANCLSGFGRRRKNSRRSSSPAMPSYCPRMMIVGTVISAGSTTGRLAHMSMYVPVGTESSRARIASANASITSSSAVPG